MKHLATLLAVAAFVFVSGCGGGGDGASAESAASQIDDLCTEQAAFNVSLPQKQSDENLSVEQVGRLAEQKSDELSGEIEDVDVPDDLADAKQKLLDLTDEARQDPLSDRASLAERIDEFGGVYAELGADRCAAYGQASLKVLDGAPPSEAYEGLPLPGVEGLDD